MLCTTIPLFESVVNFKPFIDILLERSSVFHSYEISVYPLSPAYDTKQRNQ